MDPRVCADVRQEPRLPDGAGIAQPVGEAEQTASESFLNWVADVLDWGRGNLGRAELAKKEVCGPHT